MRFACQCAEACEVQRLELHHGAGAGAPPQHHEGMNALGICINSDTRIP